MQHPTWQLPHDRHDVTAAPLFCVFSLHAACQYQYTRITLPLLRKPLIWQTYINISINFYLFIRSFG